MNRPYTVSQKTRHPTLVDNFPKYQPTFKILLLLDSAQNLLQNDHYISHHTLEPLLQYLVQLVSVIGKFRSKHTVKA